MSNEGEYWKIRYTQPDGWFRWWAGVVDGAPWTDRASYAKRFETQELAEEVFTGLVLETSPDHPGSLCLIRADESLNWFESVITAYPKR